MANSDFLFYGRVFFSRAGWRLAGLLCVVSVGSFMEVFGLAMVLPLLNLSTNQNPTDSFSIFVFNWFERVGVYPSLEVVIYSIVFIFIVKGVIVFSSSILSNIIVTGIREVAQLEITSLIGRLRYQKFIERETGYFTNLLVREVERFSSAFSKYISLLVSLVYSFFYIVGAAVLSWQIALQIFLGGIIIFLLIRNINKYVKQLSFKGTEYFTNFQTSLVQFVNGFTYLKATSGIGQFSKFIQQQIADLASNTIKLQIASISVSSIREPLAVIILAAVVLFQATSKENALSEVLVIALLAHRLFSQMMTLQIEWQKVNQLASGVYQVEEAYRVFSNEQEGYGDRIVDKQKINIRFENVSFHYGDFKALENISLEIGENKTVGIVGASGSGKTTLFYLLTGLLSPTKGRVLVNGEGLDGVDIESFRKQIGYVTQDPVVFNDSVNNNISMWQESDDESGEQRVLAAAKQAHCSDLLREITRRISDRGTNLSGGQRQRLAIARELFKNPSLLIFDEATSALDSDSENAIQKNIDEMHGEKTVVLISHRLSTVRNADLIYVLDRGRLVESGAFEKLYSVEGSLFRRMCENQYITPAAARND